MTRDQAWIHSINRTRCRAPFIYPTSLDRSIDRQSTITLNIPYGRASVRFRLMFPTNRYTFTYFRSFLMEKSSPINYSDSYSSFTQNNSTNSYVHAVTRSYATARSNQRDFKGTSRRLDFIYFPLFFYFILFFFFPSCNQSSVRLSASTIILEFIHRSSYLSLSSSHHLSSLLSHTLALVLARSNTALKRFIAIKLLQYM